jgi:glycosyltransferase involved in cell wall biosynthesis
LKINDYLEYTVSEEHGVAIIIPAHNEEGYIQQTIKSIQNTVDLVLLVNDESTDSTIKVAKKAFKSSKRIKMGTSISKPSFIILNQQKKGVGAAVCNGFKYILELENKSKLKKYFPIKEKWIIVIIDADGQMDPMDLPNIIKPIINNSADHVKGKRIKLEGMPLSRKIGSFLLKKLMQLASGYPQIQDPQCGYRAVKLELLKTWNFEKPWNGFGYPNWWLLEAGRRSFRLKEVPVKCIYNDKKSKLKIITFLPNVSVLIFRKLWLRGWDWYVLGKGIDSNFTRVGICATWFGSIILPLYILVSPKYWLLLTSLSLIGLNITRIWDMKESKRRINVGVSPLID